MAGAEARPPDDGAQFVESGSFRVDRARAVEKLSTFKAPGMGPLLFWVRLACSCGATRIRFTESLLEVKMRFDGLPLPARALRDPYAALFEEEGRSTVQERFFALGLLHAWSPSLKELTVFSGKGVDRVGLRAAALGDESLCSVSDGESDTLIVLSGAGAACWLHPAPAATLACRPRTQLWASCPIEKYQGGRLAGRVERTAALAGECEFIEEEVYGHLSIPDDPAGHTRIDVYHYGVLVATEVFPRLTPPVVGKVDDRRLALNASGSGIVRGERLSRLERLIGRRSRALRLKVSLEQRQSLPSALALMREKPALLELWDRRVAHGAALESEELRRGLSEEPMLSGWVGSSAGSAREERALVLREACATLWLRDCCEEAAGNRWAEIPAELKQAPIYFSRQLAPVSWEDLKAGTIVHAETSFENTRCRLLREASQRG